MNARVPALVGTPIEQPAIAVVAGRLLVDSRDVARQFSRAHKTVLSAIDTMVLRRPDLLGQKFLPKQVGAETANGASRETRAFDMDRDGFSLLVMGFTGEKALAWKVAYIEAFNMMEAQLRQPVAPAVGILDVLRDPQQVLALLAHHAQATIQARAELATEQVAHAETHQHLEDTCRQLRIESHRAETTGRALVVAQERIEEQAPAVEAHNALMDTGGLENLSSAARLIGAEHVPFFAWLRERKFIFPQNGWLQPDSDLRKSGYLIPKEVRCKDGVVRPQTMATPAGVVWLRHRWEARKRLLAKQAAAERAAAAEPDLFEETVGG
jgi:Rha family phage regulatory protein